MKRIIIVANNHLLNNNHIEDLKATEDDIFFLFNHMYQSYDILKEEYNKIGFLRALQEKDNVKDEQYYLGEKQIIDKQVFFNKIVLIWKLYPDFVKDLFVDNELLNIEEILEEFNIDYQGESPSSGFLGMLYAKKMFPDAKIILLGFTGKLPDGQEPPENFVHNYKWELEYYKNNKIEMVSID
jgi:hypothetical protein